MLPLVLLNGATGIGTGYSTSVPSYDPLVVSAAVRRWLKSHTGAGTAGDGGAFTMAPPQPWYRGFKGTIEEVGGGGTADGASAKLRSRGMLSRRDATKIRVTELPLGTWTEDFKTSLESLVERCADVRSFANESTDATVDFTITFSNAAAADAWFAQDAKAEGLKRLEAELKMTSTKGLSTTNMHLFNARGQIQRYATVWDVVREFCEVRLDGYARRRTHVLERLASEAAVLRNKAMFLELVAEGRLVLHDRSVSDVDLAARMTDLGLETIVEDKQGSRRSSAKKKSEDDDDDDNAPAAEEDAPAVAGFKYLLSMPMSSLTAKRKAAIDASLAAKRAEIAKVESKSSTDLWLSDIDAFEVEYKKSVAA